MSDAHHKNASSGGATLGTEPAFEFENNDESENFNLRPRANFNRPMPPEQAKISHAVYEARNILRLVKEENAVTQVAYDEFIKRVVQAGRAGCVAQYVSPVLAGEALEQIRADIVRRVGTPLTYRYLRSLAAWAAGGVVLGGIVVIIGRWFVPGIEAYGWVEIGAMVGAWFSVAASRWQIGFDTIPEYLGPNNEPLVRMLFVAIGAAVSALFLQLAILTIKIGTTDLATFQTNIGVALILGIVAGIGERTLSVQLIEKTQKALTPSRT